MRVKLVTHVLIAQNRQKQIYAGSILKQMVQLKHGEETFSFGIAPISFNWNASSQSILKTYLPRDTSSQSAMAKVGASSLMIRDN